MATCVQRVRLEEGAGCALRWHMGRLEIVWRNPNPVTRKNRWHPTCLMLERALYVVEELVSDGAIVYWSVKADLEVLGGGRRSA